MTIFGRLFHFLRSLWVTRPNPAEDYMEALFFYHNRVRLARNLPALKFSYRLMAAAQKHAAWMHEHHAITDKEITIGQRLDIEGYQWTFCGENINYGSYEAARAMIKWMKSRRHRDNIMHLAYTEVGFGKSGRYWCAIFAAR